MLQSLSSLPSCFITATDTDAGKTYISCRILEAWQNQGLKVAAFKPIASGGIMRNNTLVSEDALELRQVTGQELSEINPFVYPLPASPHLADTEHTFDLPRCVRAYKKLQKKYDRVLVEGVGGWCVPLSDQLMLKDLVNAFELPVVMVVNIKLGCINHALLTAHQVAHDIGPLHGWIANTIDANFGEQEGNIQAIDCRIQTTRYG